MNIFNYLMNKKGHEIFNNDDILSYLLKKARVHTASGTEINIKNAKGFNNLELYKLSTQDGTPTPSNPVAVNTVKGYRNLLNVLDLNQSYASVECVRNDDNSYTLDGTASSNYAINIIDNWSLTLPAGTYTLYGCPDMGGKEVLSIELYSDSPNNKYFTDVGNGITFTTTEERTFRCYIAIKNTKQYDNVNVYPMLVAGTEKLPYKPYGNNYVYTTITSGTNSRIITIPLNNNEICGIGDYKDEVVIDKNGHTTLTKKIGKVVLDGSENWVYNSSSNQPFRIALNDVKKVIDQTITPLLISNNYTAIAWDSAVSSGLSYLLTQAYNNTQIAFKNNDISSLDNWKTWLSTHNTEVYYVLAEPTTIDLGTIDIELYEGNNNITNSENMDMILKYYK